MEYKPIKEDLQQLREWLEKMPHIVKDYDDEFLSAFVKASKGSLQKSKAWLENINALGAKAPQYFSSMDPLYPRLQEYLSVWLTFVFPEKTPDGSTVIFVCRNTKSHDASKSHKMELYRYILLTFYVLVWEKKFGSGKWRLVIDYKGANLEYFREMTPMAIKTIIKVGESGLPVRFQSVSFFNVPTIIEFVCSLFKRAAKTKLSERFFVYDSTDNITKHVPQKMLPKEYGGCQESIFVLHDNWKRKVESYRQRFLEEEKKMRELDEFRPKTDDDDEMTGSFRKLAVD